MKKVLPEQSLVNELTGHSAFFRRDTTPSEPTSPHRPDPVASSPRPATQPIQTVPIAPTPSPRRPDSPKRPLHRAAFDIYADQIQAIRRLKIQRELALDRDVSGSAIVREALDFFLKSQT